ncbi:hypothetical protein, partial [Nonomuraea longicatena]|uniref:hypothetical protein n=1 Tax=Nonomuraea longicatena TaxID=83682 RepID=UPI0031DCED7C
IRTYVITKHSKGNNHIAKPEDTARTLCGKAATGEGVEESVVCGNCNRLADRRGMVEAPKLEATMEAADLIRTREAWLHRAVEILRPRYVALGLPIPERLHLSIGYGYKGRGGESRTIEGFCVTRFGSKDGVNHIFISPEIEETWRVLAVLMHELIHAGDDCASGHKGTFARVAKALGFKGKMTTTDPNEALIKDLKIIADELGEYPHGALIAPRKTLRTPRQATPEVNAEEGGDEGEGEPGGVEHSGDKPQTNRHVLLKCIAPGCDCEGYQVRTSRKWLAVGLPSCPCGNEMQSV